MSTNTCPAPSSCAFRMAALRSSLSLPSARVRQGPEDSLKASPNLACGTVLTTASYMSSAVLMKCVWPTMMLVSSGNLIRTDSNSSIGSSSAAKCAAIIAQDLRDFGTFADGTCLRSVLDPKQHKRAHLFHHKNHNLPRLIWPERNAGTHISNVPPRVVLSKRSSRMKNLILSCLALALVTSLLALAQETAKPGEMKQDTMKAEKTS